MRREAGAWGVGQWSRQHCEPQQRRASPLHWPTAPAAAPPRTVVHPEAHKLVGLAASSGAVVVATGAGARGGARLGQLVLVMGEHQVPAGVCRWGTDQGNHTIPPLPHPPKSHHPHATRPCRPHLPPPWISITSPMTSRIMALHSMCHPAAGVARRRGRGGAMARHLLLHCGPQAAPVGGARARDARPPHTTAWAAAPGRPGPQGLSHVGSPGLADFHSAKSAGPRLRSSTATRSPARLSSCTGDTRAGRRGELRGGAAGAAPLPQLACGCARRPHRSPPRPRRPPGPAHLRAAREAAVAGQRRDVEEDVAANGIGVPVGDDALDHGNHVGDVVSGLGFLAGRQAPQRLLRAAAGQRVAGRESGPLAARPRHPSQQQAAAPRYASREARAAPPHPPPHRAHHVLHGTRQ